MQQETVSVSSLLNEKNTLLIEHADMQKGELIKQLVNLACAGLSNIDTADILDRVLKREESITTTLDTGLSIPHCRVDGISACRAAMAVVKDGIKDPVADNIDIKVMFLFVSPSNPSFFQAHLQILAQLSEKFKDSFINRLTQASTAEEALKIVKQ
ncbi:MAG: PTS sugar transporter subunit IIA [Elusimicrobium sp.]|jgi:PTS system nitrogen regulatory IIA component|nr:PTS sugar transporter subunit IIA [Elusimicrobium sp.]